MKGGKEREKGTFVVRIMNRNNSTWQGSLDWVEEKKTQNFRSALELIKLIDSALDSGNQKEEK